MRKPMVYFSIYAFIGVTGWGLFNYMSGQRTFLNTAQEKISAWSTANSVDTSKVYRWQDGKGIWHYSNEKPNYDADYEKYSAELAMLKQLPAQTLPTGKIPEPSVPPEKDMKEVLSSIPGVATIQQGVNKVKNALDVQKMLDTRHEKMDSAAKEL